MTDRISWKGIPIFIIILITMIQQLWAPPTPPAGDDDVYVDNSQMYLYESEVMPEHALPPVFVRKNASKRLRTESGTASGTPLLRRGGLSKSRNDGHCGPKSLFDRPSDVLVKLRKEAKLLKLKRQPPTSGTLMAQRTPTRPQPATGQSASSPTPSGGPATPGGPSTPLPSSSAPRRQPDSATPEGTQVEWTLSEDWSILQVIQQLQELPSSLTILSPGHLPNWDLVADLLNSSVARVYRSPKQCRNRFENVLVPREEGRPNAPATAYDKKAVKKALKQRTGRPIKTASLLAEDNNASFSNMYTSRFEAIKAVSVHSAPALRPVFANNTQPNGRNAKHAAVMAEHGVNYDNPQHPQTLAKLREERVKKEKGAKTATSAAVTSQQQQQIGTTAGTTTTTAVSASPTVVSRGQAVTASQIVAGQSTLSATTTVVTTSAVSVGSSHPTTTSVMAVVGGVGAVTTAGQTSTEKILTNAQPQPIVAASTPIRTTQLVAATPVVSVTSLSPAQLQAAAQRSMAGRSVTPSQQLQFQALKHSTLIRQQGTTTAVRTAGEAGAGQMKRIQQVVTSQAIKVTSQVAPGQLVTHTTQAGVAKVGPLGQVVGQVGQTVKTATGARTVVNESELTQLLKRNQAGQQKILATGATLVKPSGVPLPVSAVTVTGITLPVAAAASAAQGAKVGPSTSGGQQRIVFQQVKKQPQLQQGGGGGAKTVSSGGLQTTTVQIVHQQPGSSGLGGGQNQGTQAIKPVAVSQIIKHVLPSGQQSNFVLTTTSSAGGTSSAGSMGAMSVTGMGGSAHAQSAQTQLFTALQQGVKSGGVATVTLTAPSSSGAPTRILTVQQQPKTVLGKQHGTETAVVQIPVSQVGNVNSTVQAVQAALQVARAQQAAAAAAQGKAPQSLPYTMRIRHSAPAQGHHAVSHAQTVAQVAQAAVAAATNVQTTTTPSSVGAGSVVTTVHQAGTIGGAGGGQVVTHQIVQQQAAPQNVAVSQANVVQHQQTTTSQHQLTSGNSGGNAQNSQG